MAQSTSDEGGVLGYYVSVEQPNGNNHRFATANHADTLSLTQTRSLSLESPLTTSRRSPLIEFQIFSVQRRQRSPSDRSESCAPIDNRPCHFLHMYFKQPAILLLSQRGIKSEFPGELVPGVGWLVT